MQEIENDESNLPEIQKRLFFLKNLERTFSLDLTQLIEKRDQLKTYFQQNDKDHEICRIQEQIENLKALAVNVLQPIRSHFDKPLIISSGFRLSLIHVSEPTRR